MLTYSQALETIFKNITTTKASLIDISETTSAYLYEDIYAPFDMPRFSNSAMDGYAIKSFDTREASIKRPIRLRVSGEVRTGEIFRKRLRRGEAFAISTGAAIPQGADAVVMKEDVRINGDKICIFREIRRYENIRKRGEDFKKGERILERSTELNPQVIALLSSLGIKRVKTYKRPEIAFISSGTELIEPGERLSRNKIYNSNYYSISSMLRKIGMEIKRHYTVRDDPDEIHKIIKKALDESDLLLISGGVSVGDVDYIKESLSKCGVTRIFWRVAIKPGKPLFFGKKGKKIIFGLPGNTVSSFVNTYLFVIPALKKMMGAGSYHNQILEASLKKDIKKKGNRMEFLRGRCEIEDGRYVVYLLEKQGSHILSSLTEANCLIFTEPGNHFYQKGESIRILLL